MNGKNEKCLNVRQLAEKLGMSERWVYTHLDDLPHLRVGRSIRFDWTEVEAKLRVAAEVAAQ